LSKALVEKFGGEIPETRDALQSLPGVGRKTANVVLNAFFGQPVIAVDRHVLRVSNRTGLANGKTPEEVEGQLMRAVPKKWRLHAHHWLVLHGRYVCKARAPDCPACIVRDLCAYKFKTK
jgi:endonuclease-3